MSRPPWWARWLERLLAPWIEIKREPNVPPFTLERPVCYVLEHYGLSNSLILDRACREAGLPSPLAPLLRRYRVLAGLPETTPLRPWLRDALTAEERSRASRRLGALAEPGHALAPARKRQDIGA